MKTKSILTAMLLIVGTHAMADDYQYLTITYGSSESNISLPLVEKISFEEDYLVVTTSEGTNHYPLSAVDKITFTESATAIKALPEQMEGLTYRDGTLAVRGDGFLRIYRTGGVLVSIAAVKEGANISLDNLPAGVYIVGMGNKTIKIKK